VTLRSSLAAGEDGDCGGLSPVRGADVSMLSARWHTSPSFVDADHPETFRHVPF
jgi:hypothetical protein